MYQIPLELDKEGTKERDGEWGKGWGGEGRLLLIFPSKGAVIRGTAIIRGNTVFNTMSFTYKKDQNIIKVIYYRDLSLKPYLVLDK